jgi:cytochrome c
VIVRCLVLTVVLSLAALIASAHLQTLAAMQTGDATRGKMVFEHRCTGCHAMDTNREGPQLRTVYGRKAGSVSGFKYSEALLSSGLTWTPATLDRWLADPDAMVPGNNMSFQTPKAADRNDIIAYFEQEAQTK